MNWLPPRSLAAQTDWAEAHPWVAGCYFELFMFVFAAFLLPVLIGTSANIRFRVAVG